MIQYWQNVEAKFTMGLTANFMTLQAAIRRPEK
jgi:hypothetical protein